MVFYLESDCYTVLKEYQKKYNSDSTIIKEFRGFYSLDMGEMAKAELFKKKPAEIIAFFNTDAGKKIKCYIKGYRNKYDLLE